MSMTRKFILLLFTVFIVTGCESRQPKTEDKVIYLGVEINGKRFEETYYDEDTNENVDPEIIESWVFDENITSLRIFFKDGTYLNILTYDTGGTRIIGGVYKCVDNLVEINTHEFNPDSKEYTGKTYLYEYRFEKEGDDRVLLMINKNDGFEMKLYPNPLNEFKLNDMQ